MTNKPTSNEPTTVERIERLFKSIRVDVAESQIVAREAESKLKLMESAFVQLRTELVVAKLELAAAKATTPTIVLSPRQEAIEAAKAFVENKFHDGRFQKRIIKWGSLMVRPEFHVNAEKGIVTCLLKGAETKKIRGRNFAKVAPNDVFNVHIGKAIALAKALGETIPNQFMDAPPPTEAEVGDIVKTKFDGVFHTLRNHVERLDGHYGKAFFVQEGSNVWLGDKQFTIVDDSKQNKANGGE